MRKLITIAMLCSGSVSAATATLTNTDDALVMTLPLPTTVQAVDWQMAWSGTGTLTFETTIDGTTWRSSPCVTPAGASAATATSSTTFCQMAASIGNQQRARFSAASGSVTVTAVQSFGAVFPMPGASAPSSTNAQLPSSLDSNGNLMVSNRPPPSLFTSGSTCGGVSTSTQCLGASGSGLSYYITDIFMSASAQQTMLIYSSTTTGNVCATNPTTIWPNTYVAAYGGGPITLSQPIKVTANSALCCITGAVAATCRIGGFIAP